MCVSLWLMYLELHKWSFDSNDTPDNRRRRTNDRQCVSQISNVFSKRNEFSSINMIFSILNELKHLQIVIYLTHILFTNFSYLFLNNKCEFINFAMLQLVTDR